MKLLLDTIQALCRSEIAIRGPHVESISPKFTWNTLLTSLEGAINYEISSVEHLLLHHNKQKTIADFYYTVGLYTDLEETEYFCPWLPPAKYRGWIEWKHDDQHSGVLISAAENKIHFLTLRREITAPITARIGVSETEFESTAEGLVALTAIDNTILARLTIVKWLETNPEKMEVQVRPAQAERRNKRGTKILKPKHSKVSVIVIDGMERTYIGGTETWTVHKHGWHNRRHTVQPFARHCASGKIVMVRGHERGDESLGWIECAEPTKVRYKVAPHKIFYGPKEVA